jgi:hypothetical protein
MKQTALQRIHNELSERFKGLPEHNKIVGTTIGLITKYQKEIGEEYAQQPKGEHELLRNEADYWKARYNEINPKNLSPETLKGEWISGYQQAINDVIDIVCDDIPWGVMDNDIDAKELLLRLRAKIIPKEAPNVQEENSK